MTAVSEAGGTKVGVAARMAAVAPSEDVIKKIPGPEKQAKFSPAVVYSVKAAIVIICAAIVGGAIYGIVENSREAGMRTVYTRQVFLQVEEKQWDYVAGSNGTNLCHGVPFTDGEMVFLAQSNSTIGSTYRKRVFVEYADEKFTTRVERPAEWDHLGFFGPVLRARVGEVLRVRLRNKSRFPASLHLYGIPLTSITDFDGTGKQVAKRVALDSASATSASTGSDGAALFRVVSDPFSGGFRPFSCVGAAANDAACANVGYEASPSSTVEYEWEIPASAGPTTTSSVGRLYQSLPYNSIDGSLSGIVVITGPESKKNPAAPARPDDIDNEAVVILSVSNENASPYLPTNVLDYIIRAQRPAGSRGAAIDSPMIPFDEVDPAEVLAALYAAAAASFSKTGGRSVPSHIAAADVASMFVAPPGNIVSVNQLNGVSIGAVFDLTAKVVDGTAFARQYGQWALEGAVSPLLYTALTMRPGFDADHFEESNLMHAFNGFVYCAQPPAEMQQHQMVRWYSAVLGTEVDMHALHWHANTLINEGVRTDSILLLPRMAYTSDMRAEAPGQHAVHCHVTDHMGAGMFSTYKVIPTGSTLAKMAAAGPAHNQIAPTPIADIAGQLTGTVRQYYIAAEVEDWDYMTPGAEEQCAAFAGSGYPASGFNLTQTLIDNNLTSVIPKARYVEYTDSTFTRRAARPAEWAHLGILGPVLRAVVGDTIRVTFLNRTPRPFSLHPHGVLYAKGSEGAPYEDGTTQHGDKGDDAVPTNGTWVYNWQVPDSAGPGPRDLSSTFWLVHGHTHEVSDENAGMIMSIIITGRGKQRSATDLRPKDVDREFVLLAKVFNEDHADEGGMVHHHGHVVNEGSEVGRMWHTLNGKVFCGLQSLSMTQGERVRFHMASLGNEVDVHHLAFLGITILTRTGSRAAGVPLIGGYMTSADAVPEVPGEFIVTTSSLHSSTLGLVHKFTVNPPATPKPAATYPLTGGSTRKYFVAADELQWNYTPLRTDACVPAELKAAMGAYAPLPAGSRYDRAGVDLNGFTEGGRVFVQRVGPSLGSVYKKAIYREYVDESFAVLKPRSTSTLFPGLRSGRANDATDPQHLGLLGPIMRVAIGDALVVVFRNNAPFPVNIKVPHGLVLVGMRNLTDTATAIPVQASLPVEPGQTIEYSWGVPASAGPGPSDFSTVAWLYTSSIHPDHLYAGFVGSILVSRTAQVITSPDVNREFVLVSFISNENKSPYISDNINALAENASLVDPADGGFQESNLLHCINGYLYCNMQGLSARIGDRVRFHLLAAGADLDIHTPTVHGHVAINDASTGNRVTAVGLVPGASQTLEFTAERRGAYHVECGVNDHWMAGMKALLVVE